MRRKFNIRQRNYIILGLCSILLVMTAGYAAFRSQLTINGTSNITSDWKVLITDIQSKTLSGTATDAETPSHTETTATFKTNLVSPGDSMQYDITVENQGDIDAVLESIDVNTSENEAILFETSGIKRGDKLLPEESDVLTVVVTYNPEVTNQPENLNSEVTVTLNYVQDDGSILPEPEGPSIGGISVPTVESGDGLYEDEYEEGRYVYRGANPNNYIEFDNGEVWRIIAKEADGTYKILKKDLFPEQTWDTSISNNWARPATLNTYLNGEYYNYLDNSIKDNIVSHTWGIGEVEYDNDDLSAQIVSEQGTTWSGNIGLIAHSDYLRANSDMANCGTDKTFNKNYITCRNTDWMYITGNYWWTISPLSSIVWLVSDDGDPDLSDAGSDFALRPAAYLKSDITLSGSGTQSDPFVIVS